MIFQRTKSLRSAILHTFHAVTGAEAADRLREFSERDWRKLGSWMQASGMGLYFLSELGTRGIEHAVPREVVRGLSQNLADNRERNLAMRSEFVRLNAAFRESGLDFLNVKGISLGAEYCPDPALRQQFDLDFWLRADQAARCEATLRKTGYRVHRSGNTLECQAGSRVTPPLADFYNPPTQRSAEIHLRPTVDFQNLPRANGILNGLVFPTLSREQTFLYHALHITKHLRSEFTRASWLLELRNAIVDGRNDLEFWRSTRAQCTDGETALLVGVAVAAAAQVFRFDVPEELAAWTVAVLPARVCAWVEAFTERVLTAHFPGTKLYLLLDQALDAKSGHGHSLQRSLLPPLRVPGYIAARREQGSGSIPSLSDAKFVAERVRFHVVEGLRFLRAQQQWAGKQSGTGGCVAKQGRSIA